MHAVRRHGKIEPRVLYWCRTPPYVKVGRAPLDEETRQLIEAQHPELRFDWDKILREQPQAMPEHEAARRREQRDSREARRGRKRQDKGTTAVAGLSEPSPPANDATGSAEEPGDSADFEPAAPGGDATGPAEEPGAATDREPAATPSGSAPGPGESAAGRRRRRRRRRGGGQPPPSTVL